MLAPDIGEQLHADADAEKGRAALHDGIFQRFDHAGDCGEAPHAIGKSPDARQHDALGARDKVRIGRDDDLVAGARSPAACASAFSAERKFPEP